MNRCLAPIAAVLLAACSVDEPIVPLPTGSGGTTSGSGGTGGEAPTSSAGATGGAEPTDAGADADAAPDADPPKKAGALVAVELHARTGVLLDDLPPEVRERAAELALAEPAEAWIARARRHVQLSQIAAVHDLTPVPLPPPELWTITLDPAGPIRTIEDGHDVVAADYGFHAVLLTDVDSPGQISSKLDTEGGVFKRHHGLPIDPDLVVQRMAADCSDPDDSPLPFPLCPTVITQRIGKVVADIDYTRLPWDPALADAARVGAVSHENGADLRVVAEPLAQAQLSYRYIPPDDCSVSEKCVGAPGWRRLLQFTASVHNTGGQALHIGDVDGSAFLAHHVYSWSPCHQHYHFLHYGDFSFGPDLGEKKAFCLLSTSRFSNNESTPLDVPYDGCGHQGIGSGWGDDYAIGLDCQWIDVTDLDFSNGPVTRELTFASNTDQFLCEGVPVTDADGEPVFEPTTFVDEQGDPVDRPACSFFPDWDTQNSASHSFTVSPVGSFVTEPCAFDVYDAPRDCGYAPSGALATCTPGSLVTLACAVADVTAPQALRVCETSSVLGTGIACTHVASVASAIAGATTGILSFTCPGPRDPSEPGGAYAIYTSPLFPGDPAQQVTCAVR